MKEKKIRIDNQEIDIVVGHATNKRHTRNPLKNMLLRQFDSTLTSILSCVQLTKILEIGSGEGDVVKIAKKLFPNCYYVAVDIDEDLLRLAKAHGADEVALSTSEPLQLPYPDESFDLVLMIEVLEHLFMPEEGLKEAKRLTKSFFIASVPNEPLWRFINILQCKHLLEFGNTPGHVNHWGKRRFYQLLSSQFHIKQFLTPFPWLMTLSKK